MGQLVLLGLLSSGMLFAQLSGFSREERIKYTARSAYERFPDGRPKVPGGLLEGLRQTTTTEIWGYLQRVAKYRSQFTGSWQMTRPEKKLIGRTVTAQFMPVRPEIHEIIEAEAARSGLGNVLVNQRVIDQLQPGDVLVVDIYGKVENGSWVGNNLTTAIQVATGNGFVINGGIRDLAGVKGVDVPVYHRGAHPTVYSDMMLTGVNVPIRIDQVTVMPGDIVFGDEEGLTFVPPQFVEGLVSYCAEQRLKDEWVQMKLRSGKVQSADVYPAPRGPELKKEFEEWLRRKKQEHGPK